MDWISCYDLAVVGGGPCGSSAAREAARSGASAILLDRARFPRYKACGGGILPRAAHWLPETAHSIVERECRRVEVHLLDADWGYAVERSHPLVSMAMRSRLDAALVQAASEQGVDVRDSTSVTGLEVRRGRVRLHTSQGRIEARMAIAADGAGGTFARSAGFVGPPRIPALEWEVRVEEEAHARFDGTARFDFGAVPHGYGWIFPKADHLSVGLASLRPRGLVLHRLLEEYLEAVGVRPIGSVERHGSLLPIRPAAGSLVRNRTVVAGDAAGFLDPVTFEGISFAVRTGILAARAILEGEFDEDRVRKTYRRSLREEILPDVRAGRMLGRLLYGSARLRTTVFRRAGPALCEAVAEAAAGNRRYREAIASLFERIRRP
jgi:geranylgeranyl reductase family protein